MAILPMLGHGQDGRGTFPVAVGERRNRCCLKPPCRSSVSPPNLGNKLLESHKGAKG
jgi:hypothetical protein